MPHIIVEHSRNIKDDVPLNQLNKVLHQCLSEQETVKLTSIKTRSIEVDNVIIGDGQSNNFIHITVLLLAGRSDKLKQIMADNLYTTALTYTRKLNCLLSINISELGTYRK